MKFVRKDTDYGAYRELLKNGNKIVGWVEQRPTGEFFYAYGKPSQSSYISFECKSLLEAKEEIIENAR